MLTGVNIILKSKAARPFEFKVNGSINQIDALNNARINIRIFKEPALNVIFFIIFSYPSK